MDFQALVQKDCMLVCAANISHLRCTDVSRVRAEDAVAMYSMPHHLSRSITQAEPPAVSSIAGSRGAPVGLTTRQLHQMQLAKPRGPGLASSVVTERRAQGRRESSESSGVSVLPRVRSVQKCWNGKQVLPAESVSDSEVVGSTREKYQHFFGIALVHGKEWAERALWERGVLQAHSGAFRR
ncbi:hypothetical protein M427DRAFT_501483, partial [Gonapodya prolifera JEL478]